MIRDIDIWRAAKLMTRCFRHGARHKRPCAARDLEAAGEVEGCAIWRRIAAAAAR